MTTLSVVEGTLLKNFEAWVKAKGLPFVVAEWGLLAADPDRASKMQTFCDNMTDGARDCLALAYCFNSAPGGDARWMLTDSANGGMLSKFKALMVAPESTTMTDLGSER
jgi:hypothetical protein